MYVVISSRIIKPNLHGYWKKVQLVRILSPLMRVHFYVVTDCLQSLLTKQLLKPCCERTSSKGR